MPSKFKCVGNPALFRRSMLLNLDPSAEENDEGFGNCKKDALVPSFAMSGNASTGFEDMLSKLPSEGKVLLWRECS